MNSVIDIATLAFAFVFYANVAMDVTSRFMHSTITPN